jgi:NADPH:quinone reductase-like Zn-dependent oxidoreductase
MSAVVLTSVGDLQEGNLTLTETPVGSLGSEGVMVEIDAAPINNADLMFAAGWLNVQPTVPSRMGAEGVGRVVEAGSAVDPSLVGRRVIVLPTLPAFPHGTWADRAVVPASGVIAMTEQADIQQLAMLAVNPATARSLLHDYVDLQAGDWIAVTLANSAVGQYVLALAAQLKVNVLAVVRREEVATQLRHQRVGAVVVHGEQLAEEVARELGGNRLRMLLDGVGGAQPLGTLAGFVEDAGTIVSFSAATGEAPVVPLADLIYRGVSLRSFSILSWIDRTPRLELERIYTELAELVGSGVLTAEVEKTYPLEQFQEAIEHAARNGRSGKVLFVPERTTS